MTNDNGEQVADEIEADRIKEARFLVSGKPDIAVEQAFYLIRLGADIILNASVLALKKTDKHILVNNLHDAHELLNYLHMKLGQLEMAGSWMKSEGKKVHKAVLKKSKQVSRFKLDKS